MTAPEIERTETVPVRRTSTRSAGKAYERRTRREQAHSGRSLTRTGSPIAAALSRVPFVATVILLLAGGIVGVLWLNTMSDAAGLSASQSRIDQQDLKIRMESVGKDIAALKNPALLATEASSLGLVPPGEAAILLVGKDGSGTVIGTPTPVAAPAPAAAVRATAAPATTAPVTPAPATLRPAATTPLGRPAGPVGLPATARPPAATRATVAKVVEGTGAVRPAARTTGVTAAVTPPVRAIAPVNRAPGAIARKTSPATTQPRTATTTTTTTGARP